MRYFIIGYRCNECGALLQKNQLETHKENNGHKYFQPIYEDD